MNLLTLVLGFFLVASPVDSQSTGQPAGGSAEMPTPASAQLPGAPSAAAYKIGVDDELSIYVSGDPEMTKVYQVRADGTIILNYVDPIVAKGLTAIELTDRIKTTLMTMMVNPTVSVRVSKYGSQFVSVAGEVRQSTRLPMTGPMTLLDALMAVGFVTEKAGTKVVVTRLGSEGAETSSWEVNLADLRAGRVRVDLVGGDIIDVPKAESIYVRGQVRTTGEYTWEPGLTIDKAITKAGGVSDRGRKSGFTVERVVDGKQKTVDVKATDLVQPNDIINVPMRRI